MSNINLNLYRIFCKVAQSRSYSDASEKLDLSVSNISTQITNLEEQLNLKLFNRENKGVTLTEDGKELYEIVNSSISSFDFVEKLARDKNNISNGCIKIGCASNLANYFLMEKIEQVKRDYPKLHVKIICEVDKNKMIELLQKHEIDFAIIDYIININNIEIKKLITNENIFVSKKPLKILNINELKNFNCILNFENTRNIQKLKEVLQKYNVKIKADIACDATEVRVDAVKRNLGIAYVTQESVKKELEKKKLYKVELPIELPSIDVYIAYIRRELNKIDKKFINDYL